jgi:ElaB/YqjD/DUF883 family membrane-anchored ribosome-binding protein
MYDEKKLAMMKQSLGGGGHHIDEDTLEDLSHDDLRALRDQINAMLPDESLSGMDMTTELMNQYRRVLKLQRDCMEDLEVPPNQKAQVAAQVKSTLGDLVRMQTEFYTSERFRSIENLLIKYMKTLPIEMAKTFLAEYERLGAADV